MSGLCWLDLLHVVYRKQRREYVLTNYMCNIADME